MITQVDYIQSKLFPVIASFMCGYLWTVTTCSSTDMMHFNMNLGQTFVRAASTGTGMRIVQRSC